MLKRSRSKYKLESLEFPIIAKFRVLCLPPCPRPILPYTFSFTLHYFCIIYFLNFNTKPFWKWIIGNILVDTTPPYRDVSSKSLIRRLFLYSFPSPSSPVYYYYELYFSVVSLNCALVVSGSISIPFCLHFPPHLYIYTIYRILNSAL